MSQTHDTTRDDEWSSTRAAILRNAAGIGLASGAYAISFGAIGAAAGLSPLQISFMSLCMFTGASQFAFLGVVAAHGTPLAGAATAILLGIRNALYGLRLSPLLDLTPLRRPLAAHFVIDETTAMAIAPTSMRAGRLGFWATGVCLFVCWNAGTLIGAFGAKAIASPTALGLDAAVPAAFLALLAPRMTSQRAWLVAISGSVFALVALPFVPAGVPVLVAATVAAILGLRWARIDTEPAPAGQAKTST